MNLGANSVSMGFLQYLKRTRYHFFSHNVFIVTGVRRRLSNFVAYSAQQWHQLL